MNRLRQEVRLLKTLVAPSWKAAPALTIVTIAISTLAAIGSALYPIGFRIVIDAADSGDRGRIVAGAVIVSLLFTSGWILAIVGASQSGELTDKASLYLGERIAGLVSSAPGIEHLERTDYLREIDQIRSGRRSVAAAVRQLLGVWQTVIRSAGTVILLATIYPPVLIVPIVGLAPMLADRRANRIQKQSGDELAEDQRLLNELFQLATSAGPAKELRAYGITGAVIERHRRLAASIRKREIAAGLRAAAWEALGWVLLAVGFFGSILILVLRAAHGETSVGQVVMAVSLLRRAQKQVVSASDTAGALGNTLRTGRRLMWLEDWTAVSTPVDLAPPPERLEFGIRLEDVSFTYPSRSKPALEHIDLMLPKGAIIAIVGENGSGKTSLVKLLTGMYRPDSGRILLDDVDLAGVDPVAWRERCSAAFQDAVRFQLVAREVVGIGDLPRAKDEAALTSALEQSGGVRVIEALPDGLDALLGRSFDGGRDLSGGQWQRLALARGLMRSDPLLVALDEPAASLDPMAEAALFRRYAEALRQTVDRDSVTLLISHRLASVRAADLIVVMEQGRVVETGSHDALIAAGGLYAELFALQAKGYAAKKTAAAA